MSLTGSTMLPLGTRALDFNLLGFIVEIRKSVAQAPGIPGHVFRAVIRMGLHVVGIDSHNRCSPVLVLFYQSGEVFLDVLDIGTVVAHEDHQQGFGSLEIR